MISFRVGHFVAFYVVATTAILSGLLYYQHSSLNVLDVALFFFLSLNILICVWEIALGLHINVIKSDYNQIEEGSKLNVEPSPMEVIFKFFDEPLSCNTFFSLSYWSKVWSIYALFDKSYINQESFGFFADIGNGWVTLIPSLLFIICMIKPIMHPRIIAIIGILTFYQECYGTMIYFLSYLYNKRYANTNLCISFSFVLFANGIWFIFPIFGMYACIDMIMTGSYRVFC